MGVKIRGTRAIGPLGRLLLGFIVSGFGKGRIISRYQPLPTARHLIFSHDVLRIPFIKRVDVPPHSIVSPLHRIRAFQHLVFQYAKVFLPFDT